MRLIDRHKLVNKKSLQIVTDTPKNTRKMPFKNRPRGAERKPMTNELMTVPGETGQMMTVQTIGLTMQAAEMLAKSTVIPGVFQRNSANCLIALDMALRLQVNPLMVMQNLYIIDGKPSWSGQFLIAVINKSGYYKTPLRFDMSGDGDDYGCVAWVIDKSGERLESTKITIAMAKQEKWWSKRDKNGNEVSKWQSMPEQMMRYRAASFFARTYCPEITMGLMTQEEALDTEAVPSSFTSQLASSTPDEAANVPAVAQSSSPPVASPPHSAPPVPPAVNPMWDGSETFPPSINDRLTEIEHVKRLVAEGFIDKAGLVDALVLYGVGKVSELSDAALESLLEHVRLVEQIVDETTK